MALLPCLLPTAIEAGAAGDVEEPVVDEPEGCVADHVVGHAKGLGLDVGKAEKMLAPVLLERDGDRTVRERLEAFAAEHGVPV